MNMDLELAAWRTDWQARQPLDAAMLRLDLRRLIERERRKMGFGLFDRFLVGAIMLLFPLGLLPFDRHGVDSMGGRHLGRDLLRRRIRGLEQVRNMEGIVTIERCFFGSLSPAMSSRVARAPNRTMVSGGATGNCGGLVVMGLRDSPSPDGPVFFSLAR